MTGSRPISSVTTVSALTWPRWTIFSSPSTVCTAGKGLPVTASAWLRCGASSSATAAGFGLWENRTKGQPFSSSCQSSNNQVQVQATPRFPLFQESEFFHSITKSIDPQIQFLGSLGLIPVTAVKCLMDELLFHFLDIDPLWRQLERCHRRS